MKKKLSFLVIVVFLILSSVIPVMPVQAKTLNDLYNEKNKLKIQKDTNLTKKKQTEAQINKAKNDIISASRQIEQAQTDIIKAEEEIVELTIEIEKKEEETKELINFLQISQGESAYLEYAFGAKDFTDFIYRLAITEQLSKHNDELLKMMNDMITQNKAKKKKLAELQINLQIEKTNLSKKMNSLGKDLDTLVDANLDINAEIKAIEELIKSYEAMGCKKTDDLSVCAKIPLDTKFSKPILSGKITSNFGNREYYLNGKLKKDYHYGIDMYGGYGDGTPIYASANGRVAAISLYNECGGHMLFIHHMINNKPYTTAYFHLLSIKVKVGDLVTKNTIIATMGGGSTSIAKGGYDNCTTGSHLHFQIASGHYLGTAPLGYSGYATFRSSSINPRNFINFPPKGVYW